MDIRKFKAPQGLHEEIGAALVPFGGILRCEVCGRKRMLGNVGKRLANGWPKHCGYTMRWWTQDQIDAGEMPAAHADPA